MVEVGGGSKSQEGGRLAWGEEHGIWPHRVQASLSASGAGNTTPGKL